jgi:uncharacterized SAM-dependent methyltransferase
VRPKTTNRYTSVVANAGPTPRKLPQDFKDLFERCLAQAGLSPHTLHQELLRQVRFELPENTIDSWRRPHTTTGVPSLPREQIVQVVAEWLCAREHVTVTEEELLAAWRSDKAARAARGSTHSVGDDPTHGPRPVRLARGEWYEGIIDATIFIGMHDLLGRVDHRLRELLNAGQPIPTYYAYLTPRGYLNWVNLTEDHRYTYNRAGVELCETNANEIAREITRAAGDVHIDFVSLGPGTGPKDRALIQALAAVASDGGSLYYYPYDINPAMIVHSIQTVLGGELPAKVFVKGIIAPFDSLGLFSHVYKDRAAPNVLALLGNTLGNMSDDFVFLETVFASGMWPGDLLLLEVRCHVDKEAGKAPGMGEESKKRFNFGPLESLGAVYEKHRDLITIRREHSRSFIPNTVTTVTRCERVTCGAMKWRDVRLAYVHEYSEADLDAVITGIGYIILKKFHRGVRSADQEGVVLLYLLQKE